MESAVKVAGHAAHQQLVVLPLGLLATSVVFDVVQLVTDDARFTTASYLMIAAGVVTGLLAAVPGLVDWVAIPEGTRAKRVGAVHGLGNVLVVGLFAVSWLLRVDEPAHVPGSTALALAVVGALLAGVTGWLGGELVGRLGVGVDPEAHLDAPASFETGVRLGRTRSTLVGHGDD